MEEIIDKQTRSNAMKVAPLHANQKAYRAGTLINTALHQLTAEIQSSLDNRMMICLFLDIEGVTKAIENRNVIPPVRRCIEAVLHTRISETTAGDTKIRFGTTRGCPQGEALSPLAWSIVVDEVLDLLTNNGIPCQDYADDIVMLY